MKVCFWWRLQRVILIAPLPFELNIVIKDLFFIICNDIFSRNKSFLYLERRLVSTDMWSSLLFSPWVWGTHILSLLTFAIFFRWQEIVDLDVLRSPTTQDTAGEARTNSSVMYSYGPSHMAKKKQDDHLEHTYSSYVRIRDVALKTCQKRWMIGRSGERGSGISVLVARHDDDDDYFSSSFA